MTIRVLDTGVHSLLVDAGRPRSRSLGMPVGGAADRGAWMLANALIGNSTDAVALEVALAGPTLQAETDCTFALFGAAFDVSIDDSPIPVGRVFRLKTGQILRIHGVTEGMRGYLTTPGGFDSPIILNSRSALTPIQRGDVLTTGNGPILRRYLPAKLASPLIDPAILGDRVRILPGPQADLFERGILENKRFRVTSASNRMGLRLSGEALIRVPSELISEPVAPGAVQVTNDGQCIILGIDGQTIGGYPKIAHVIRADLDRLAQLRPETMIEFETVTMEMAEHIERERQQRLREWRTRLSVTG